MPQINPKHYLNAGQALPAVWPSFLPELPEGSFLDDIWVAPLETDDTAEELIARSSLLINGNLELGIPGVDAVKLMISAVGGSTYIPLEVQIRPDFAFRMKDMPLALRFSKDILKPVRRAPTTGADQPAVWEVDTTKEYVDIQFAEVSLEINGDGDISIDMEGQIDLPPVMLGDSGVVIEAHGITLHLDANSPPPGQPVGWKGIHIGQASVYLPGELGEIVGNLQLTNAYIGNGGFTGSISTTWTPALHAELFGMEFTLQSVGISFVQNSLTASSIAGTITLPFFDSPVPVEIAINLNGTFTVRIGAPGNGLLELTKPGLLELELQSLGFELKEDNLFIAKMSGSIRPLLGGLDWPGFEVRELSIDSHGNVHIDGGWLDLREQYSLSFYGFTVEITKLGFGNNDDGSRWIGFSGSMKLIDGFKAGASVEGLKITFGNGAPSISLDGVGVEFEVPDVLRFKGEVAYRKLTQGSNEIHRFDGSLKLELMCIDLVIDAEIVIGTASGPDGNYVFMGIYLGIELPAGIPLWATGLALYGMAGLFAFNMVPDRQENEPWYGMAPGEGWYKRPEIGVTDLSAKWRNNNGGFALGAGITIGTLPDNGFTFNGRMLFLLSFPGPVLMIEGKANILKARSSLGDDPIFRCLVVLDFNAGDFLVGIDVRYKFDDAGRVIDIGASAEMYFSFSDPSSWHLYLGQKEPRERRIRAHILSLFEANSYYMLDNNSLAMGAWVGYDAHWGFGPLSVTLEAWLETNAKVSWRPVHFYGDIWAHGKVELRVFGFGLGLSLDAYMEGDVFDPFHILARFSVGINLPWPLPDFDVEITLEWGPEPVWPLPPVPLKEIAVEHFKVTTSWPLTHDANLLAPVYTNADGLRIDWTTNPVFNTAASPPANAPVVPMDCRPHVTFSRQVHDLARVGTMVSLVDPAQERIGDPERNEGPVLMKYSVTEVALDAWDGGSWDTVARRAASSLPANPAGVDELFGSWAPTPPMPDGGGNNQGQTKLWLWSKNPFDYVRHGGREWQDWVADHFDDMPCVDIPEQTEHCWTFDPVALGGLPALSLPPSPFRIWQHPEPGPILAWISPDSPEVLLLDTPEGEEKGFCLPNQSNKEFFNGRNILLIAIPEGENRGVRVYCRDPELVFGIALDADGAWHGAIGGHPSDPVIEFLADNIRLIVLFWRSRMCIWRICRIEGASQAEIDEAVEIATHNINELERWKNISPVLKPHTDYRLLVRSLIEATGVSPLSGSKTAEQVEYGFFRTEGGPGLADLSIPLGVPDEEGVALKDKDGNFIHLDGTPAPAADRTLASPLNDLGIYVRQTLPPTVPGKGENRPLPKPVYRGYDLGVAFNEDYVSQMYRMDGRDLSLYVYDSNSLPVRDAEGRLIVITSAWDVASDLILDEAEKTWVTTVQKSSCGNIDETDIPHDQTLNVSGLVLEPDFVHEARLTAQLLHETFTDEDFYANGDTASGTGARLGRWQVEDNGVEQGPSLWRIAEVGAPAMRVVQQTSNIHSLPVDGRYPAKAGTVLLLADRDDLPAGHADQPGEWTDYRITVQMRSSDDDAIGLVFRRSNASRWYRFSMDRERGYRRLVRAVDGFTTILAEDDFVYRVDQDYTIVVEAIGGDIAVYQDGELVFHVYDESMDHGRIGLYTWASAGAQFSDIRVDDYRANARTVYRYQFTTSQYVHFAHQVHSYQDEVWSADLPAAAINLATAGAVASNVALSDNEARVWEAFAAHADVAALLSQKPQETEITRLMQGANMRGFLVRCPEPFAWNRCGIALSRTEEQPPLPNLPEELKLTGVTRDDTDANGESVSILFREALNPNGYAVEQQRLPGALKAATAKQCLLEDSFDGEGGVLYEETFGDNTLDLYEIVDLAAGSSHWMVNAGRIEQTSNIYGGSFSMGSLPKPGTLALTGSPDWTNVRVRVRLESGDDDSIGFVFRYTDEENFYRFEINRQFGYRRLVKCVGGTFTSLWQDNATYAMNRTYELEVRAYRRKLYGFVDGALVFFVEDDGVKRGRVGFYSWANVAARFSGLIVEEVAVDPLLWKPDFDTLAGFITITAPGAVQGPANWQVEPGGVVQLSNAHTVPLDVLQAGTYLLGGSEWDDHIICVRLRSDDNDAIGIMFRVANSQNYYRFSMDRERNRRRLVKVIGGVPTILWQDATAYSMGVDYDVTIRAIGTRIDVIVNGTTLVSTEDADIRAGRIALYSWANQGAHFSRLAVFDGARRIQRWQIVDIGTSEAPSDWQIGNGRLKQRSNIWGGSTAALSANKPGTLAITGNSDWRDYRVTAKLWSDDDDAIGLVVRYVDAGNYYYFAIDAQRNYRRLVKVEDGVMTTLWNAPGGYTPGDITRLTIDAIGNRISGYMGDTALFSVIDATHTQGRIGLYCWGNNRADFEHIEVCVPPQEAHALFFDDFRGPGLGPWAVVDKGGEAAPSNWSVVDGELVQSSNIHSLPVAASDPAKEGTYAVTGDVGWQDVILQLDLQSDDDDAIGVMFRYKDDDNYYRFSMDRERGYRRLVSKEAGVFRVIWQDNRHYEQGRKYRLTIVAQGERLAGFIDGVTVFDVRDFQHLNGRVALYCWAVEGARFSRVRIYPVEQLYDTFLLEEDFPVLRTFRWQFIDEGNQNAPSAWDVAEGKLVQTSNISHSNASRAFGTLAVAHEHDWEDYRVTAVMRSSTNGHMGVIFRYVDDTHYYRFSLTAGGDKRLIRRNGNQIEELWSESGGYLLNRDYALTVDCIGQRIMLYLNGVKLAEVVDTQGYSHGTVGLYCSANTGFEVESIRVAAPQWEPYYRFSQEERLAAGTRLRIRSGSEAEPFVADPLEENRFVTEPFSTGDVQFTDPVVQLRVVHPEEGAQHMRRFLPESSYSNMNCRLLRKADGTAFVILPQGNAPFPVGTYRAELEYKRDISATDAQAPVLSERGIKDAERAVITIPKVQEE